MWYAVCVFAGFLLGVISTWAVERRRYEVLVRESQALNAAIAEVMEAVADALTKLAQANGGNRGNG